MTTRRKSTLASGTRNTRDISPPSAEDDIRVPEVELPLREADREALISQAAYYRAEKRGFEPGHALEDWLAAEADVAAGRVPGGVVKGQD